MRDALGWHLPTKGMFVHKAAATVYSCAGSGSGTSVGRHTHPAHSLDSFPTYLRFLDLPSGRSWQVASPRAMESGKVVGHPQRSQEVHDIGNGSHHGLSWGHRPSCDGKVLTEVRNAPPYLRSPCSCRLSPPISADVLPIWSRLTNNIRKARGARDWGGESRSKKL